MFKTTKAPSLQRRIQIFGASMIVMILLVSGLLGLAALRSMVSYQQIMNQMVKIQQVKAEISTVGQLIQDHVVSNENNLEEYCCVRIHGDVYPTAGDLFLLHDWESFGRFPVMFCQMPLHRRLCGSLPAVKVHMGAAENFTHRSCEAGSVTGG